MVGVLVSTAAFCVMTVASWFDATSSLHRVSTFSFFKQTFIFRKLMYLTTGHGLKVCSAYGEASMLGVSHSYTNREQVQNILMQSAPCISTAWAEVFTKTLALFCVLREHGCSFRTTVHATEYPIMEDSDSEPETDDGPNATCPPGASTLFKHSQRSQQKPMDENMCCGRLVMLCDHYNQYYIVYEIFVVAASDITDTSTAVSTICCLLSRYNQ